MLAPGRDPHGNTVTNPDPRASVTVTFNDTAPTPDTGTPATPATRTRNTDCPTTTPLATTDTPCASPSRVSNNRTGDIGTMPSTVPAPTTTMGVLAPTPLAVPSTDNV